MSDFRPVPPDAVHVWRGYKAKGKDWVEFAQFLGQVFIPTGSMLQPGAGLHAFVPSMPAPGHKPDSVPDQSALMFWTNQQAYHDGFETVAVRAYTNLHGGAYGPPSSAEFPVSFAGQIEAEQPYYLIDAPADWMRARVRHLLGAPKDPKNFFSALADWATALQKQPPAGLWGALLCAGEGYVAAWLAWDPSASSPNPMEELAALTEPALDLTADTYHLPAGLWDPWPGIDLTQGESSLNIQLPRPTQ